MRHVQFFASLAEASLSPYFGDAGGDSTSDLLTNSQVSYHCSFFFFFLNPRGATFPYGKKHDDIYLFNFHLLYFFLSNANINSSPLPHRPRRRRKLPKYKVSEKGAAHNSKESKYARKSIRSARWEQV
jgi:hypothetical protein